MRYIPNIRALYVFFSLLFFVCLFASIALDFWYAAFIPFAVLILLAGWQYLPGLFFLLLFTLPFSTELQVGATLGTDFPDELLMLAVSAIAVCYCVNYRQHLVPFLRHPLFLFLVVTLAWSLLTVVFSQNSLISWKYILAKGWYIGAFVLAPFLVFRDKHNIRIAAIVFAVSLLLVVLIVMVRHYSYGFSFAGINDSLKPFFRNHVNYSAMLVCVIPIFVAIYQLHPNSRRYSVATVLVLVAALFFSFARGAWLALLISVAVYFLIKRKWLVPAYLFCIIAVSTGFFWIKAEDRYLQFAHDFRTTIFHENFREHLRATYQFKDVSTAERFYRWIAGVRMIKEDPLTGFGPGTFYNHYKPYAIPAFKTWVSNNPERSTVHNYFLMVTIEQGIPGLILFLILLGMMLYYAQYLYWRIRDPFYKTASITIGAILSMIITVNFLSDLIETDKVGSLFFLCLAMLIVIDVNSRNMEARQGLKPV